MSTVKEKIAAFVTDSDQSGFLRFEFKPLGSAAAITRGVNALISEGRLARIGYGVYAPAKNGRLIVRESDAVLDVLTKLGAEPTWGGRAWRDYVQGLTTQVPFRPTVTVRKRITRRLGRGNKRYCYERAPIPGKRVR